MSSQTCQRCRHEEYIPTHQYVKFDDRVNYLCRACWDRFHEWFNTVQPAEEFSSCD